MNLSNTLIDNRIFDNSIFDDNIFDDGILIVFIFIGSGILAVICVMSILFYSFYYI